MDQNSNLHIDDLQIEELQISDFLTEQLQKDSESVSKVMSASCTTCTCCCSCLPL